MVNHPTGPTPIPRHPTGCFVYTGKYRAKVPRFSKGPWAKVPRFSEGPRTSKTVLGTRAERRVQRTVFEVGGLASKTVNHLDERQGNFDSLRGWVCFQTHWRWETQRIQHLIGWWWSPLYDWLIWGCQDPADPASDWLIVVQALSLADLRVPRVADSKVGCQIAFSWPVLAKSSPFI